MIYMHADSSYMIAEYMTGEMEGLLILLSRMRLIVLVKGPA